MAYTYSRIHSSWSTDRVGSCVISKAHKAPKARKATVFAQYRGTEVSVCSVRGKKLFTVKLDQAITSALVKEGVLRVETADGTRREYDFLAKRLLSEQQPQNQMESGSQAAYSLAA